MKQFEVAAHAHLAIAISVVLQDIKCTYVVPEEAASTENVVMVHLVGTGVFAPAIAIDLKSVSTLWPTRKFDALMCRRWVSDGFKVALSLAVKARASSRRGRSEQSRTL